MSLTLRILLLKRNSLVFDKPASLCQWPRAMIYVKLASEGAGKKTQYWRENYHKVMGTVKFYKSGEDFPCCTAGTALLIIMENKSVNIGPILDSTLQILGSGNF